MMMWLLALTALVALAEAGGPSGRIVAGDDARAHSYPSQLSLQRNGGHICGAVVFNQNYALTAAHCVDPSDSAAIYTVVCGVHSILDNGGTWQTRQAASFEQHPDWNPNGNGFPNDIAVIRLSAPFDFDNTCQAAVLPTTNRDYANKDSFITGWGRVVGGGAVAVNLQEAAIRTLSHSDCRSMWGIFFNPIRTDHICVFDNYASSPVVGACNGDSGGPLYTPDAVTGLMTVAGLTSFGRANCDVSYPSVYTRVGAYLSWIQQATN